MSGAIQNIFTNVLQSNKIRYLLSFLGILLIPVLPAYSQAGDLPFQIIHGAIVRGDTTIPDLALVFTGDEYADGGMHIASVLADQGIKASFFLTGKFYRNPEFEGIIRRLKKEEHYLGAHSDQHLLYCSWEDRDSLLVTKRQFQEDLLDNYRAMQAFGVQKEEVPYFLPPYEWYNDSIAAWTKELQLQLINFTFGTLSHTDYTVPGTKAYRSSKEIYHSILEYESSDPKGLNGFILLVHIGTEAKRTDKFYFFLEELLKDLKAKGYAFIRIDELLGKH